MPESLDAMQQELAALQSELRDTVRRRQDIENASPEAHALRTAIRRAHRDRDSLAGPTVQAHRDRNAALTHELQSLWADMDHIRWMLRRLDQDGGRVLHLLPQHAKDLLSRLLSALGDDAKLRISASEALAANGIEGYEIPEPVRLDLSTIGGLDGQR